MADPEDRSAMLGTGQATQLGSLETLASTAPTPADRDFARGHTLGRYVVLDVLGRGGMGVVYSAFDPDLDRRVAIKVMRRSAANPKRAAAGLARLLREAKALAKLNHSNVISVYDVGPVDDTVFVAMEFVDGQTLRDRLKAAGGRLSPDEALSLYADAGEGLAVAHEAGLVHRDFKPENVMVARDGRVVVLDFGLAAPSSEELSPSSSGSMPTDLTATGDIMGTPAYMSPEQITGSSVDIASDQFSFCVALYEALYGERPFTGQSVEELRGNLVSASLPDEPGATAVPRHVRRALAKGLQRLPDDRHESMRALLDSLTTGPSRRGRRRIAMLGGATAVVAAGAAFALRPPPADPCAAAPTAIDEVWDQRRADAIRAGFSQQSPPEAKTTGAFVVDALETYATEWRAQRIDACAANQIRRDESDLLYSHRLQCLEERLAAFTALATALTEPDAYAIERGTRIVAELPTLQLCADATYLMADAPPPATADVQAEALAIKREAQAILARARQKDEQTAVDAAALTERAQATEYDPIIAYALGIEADVERALRGDSKTSERMAFKARLAAELAGDERLVLDALMSILEYRIETSQPQSAADLLAVADVILRRLGDPAVLRLAWLRMSGKAAHAQLDPERALTFLEQARELRRETGTLESVWAIGDEQHLAQAYTSVGRLDDARTSLEHTLKLCQEHLGPKHPAVGATYLLLGNLELGLANPAAALAHYDRAETIESDALEHNRAFILWQRSQAKYLVGDLIAAEAQMLDAIALSASTRGEEHSNTAAFRANMGSFLLNRGRIEDARPYLERAQKTFASRAGDDHPTMQLAHTRLADYHRLSGEADAALALYRKTLDVPSDDADLDARRLALTGVGLIALDAGRTAEAIEHLEDAVAIDVPQDYERQLAFAQFALARALATQGTGLGRAHALATSARENFAAIPTQPEALARVDAWLAAHPRGPG